MHYTVGVNEFVKRQVKNTGKTYSLISFEEIASYAEGMLNMDKYIKGYRDGVIIIKIKNQLINKFICPFVKIDDDTKLTAEVSRRRDDEEPYIRIKADKGSTLKIGHVDIILYRSDVLKETNEQTTNSDWELISFHAVPHGIDNMPMGPVTMMRNQLQLKGGTKGNYSSQEWAESTRFWQQYAIKE